MSAARGPKRHAGRNTLRREEAESGEFSSSPGSGYGATRDGTAAIGRAEANQGAWCARQRSRKFVRQGGADSRAGGGRKIPTSR